MVLIRPAFGEPRISQAIAPTKGERNSGAMMHVSITPLAGRSVRATSQASSTPASGGDRARPARRSASVEATVRQIGERGIDGAELVQVKCVAGSASPPDSTEPTNMNPIGTSTSTNSSAPIPAGRP